MRLLKAVTQPEEKKKKPFDSCHLWDCTDLTIPTHLELVWKKKKVSTLKLFQWMKPNFSRSLTHEYPCKDTLIVLYVWGKSSLPSLPHTSFFLPVLLRWQPSSVDSPSCPSHSTYTLWHLSSHKHESDRPITDLHTALPVIPCAILEAVNLANCVNTWPHLVMCLHSVVFFTHAVGVDITLLPSRSFNSPLA